MRVKGGGRKEGRESEGRKKKSEGRREEGRREEGEGRRNEEITYKSPTTPSSPVFVPLSSSLRTSNLHLSLLRNLF